MSTSLELAEVDLSSTDAEIILKISKSLLVVSFGHF
jgi:hypothetical protein